MVGQQLPIGLHQADVDEGIALRLDAAEDLARQAARDPIGLHEHQGLFDGGGHTSSFPGSAIDAVLSRSIRAPAIMQYHHMPPKSAPTKNIAGLRNPAATMSTCSTQPTV